MKRSSQATLPMINKTKWQNIEIPLPPLPQQKQIVAILDKAFAAIDTAKANAEQNLQNAKELFESYLQNVFENKGDDWEEKTLEQISESVFAGGDKPKGNFSKEKTEDYTIPIYANAVKKRGLYGYTNKARVLKPSVTISARGSGTGHTELRKESFYPIVRLIVVVPNSEIIDLQFLKHSIDNLDILRSGSAIPQLTVPMMKKYIISYPSIEEQEKIVQKLDTLTAECKKLEAIYTQKVADLDEMKKSVLQKAFSGQLNTIN
jgi:type I restriction enzyme S subunit